MRTAILGLLTLASASVGAPHPTGEAALAAAIGNRVPMPAVDCIDPQSVRSTQVIAGIGIVYDVGGRLYVNRPPSGAGRLRSDDILVTRIAGGELCRIDTITLVDPATRAQHGFVILGPFAAYGPRP